MELVYGSISAVGQHRSCMYTIENWTLRIYSPSAKRNLWSTNAEELKKQLELIKRQSLSFRIAAKNKKKMKMYAGMCLYTSVGKGGIDSMYYWRCYRTIHTRVERPDWVTLDLIKRR